MLARLARFRHFGEDITGSVALLRQALAEAGDDPRLHVEIEEGLVWGLLLVREDLEGAERRTADPRSPTRSGSATTRRSPRRSPHTRWPWPCWVGTRASRWTARIALEPATLGLRVLRHPSFALGYLQSRCRRARRGPGDVPRAPARAEAHGDDSSLPPILQPPRGRRGARRDAGRWPVPRGRRAPALALQSGQVPSQVAALGRVALALAMGDDAEAARQAARRALELADPGRGSTRGPAARRRAWRRAGDLGARALALSLGDHAGADQYLGPLCRFLLDVGVAEPGEVRPLGDAIEALAGLGRLAEAAVLSERLGAMAHRTGRPSVVGTAARSRAIVVAAGGDVEAALAARGGGGRRAPGRRACRSSSPGR